MVMHSKIDFIDLITQKDRIKEQTLKSFEEILDSGGYIQGQAVHQLEDELASYTDSKHVIACSSGTDAILLAMMSMDLEKGDTIIIPSFGFVAAAEMAILCGLNPFFVDSDPDTYNITADYIEEGYKEAIKKNLKPKAVVAIDTYGLPCDYNSIRKVCDQYNLQLIEDCAQSFGAVYKEAKAGSLADIGCTSFFPSKPLGCYGDGGAVFTNDDKVAGLIRSKIKHGQSDKKYDYITTGINGRLDTLQAAVLINKLKILDDELTLRANIAEYYRQNLESVMSMPVLPKYVSSAWAQYTLKHENREYILNSLKQKSIPFAIHYPKPLHLQKPYETCPIVSSQCPNALKLSQSVFSIPMHPYLEKGQQDFIIEALKEGL